MNRRLAGLFAPSLLASAGLLGGVTQSGAPVSQSTTSLSAADHRSLEKVVAEVREAILSKNVKALLRHISRTEPLVCTDTGFSFREVQRFLQNQDSHLYMSLFDSARFAASCGKEYPPEYPTISDREFLATANPGAAIARLDNRWAEVTMTSAVKGHFAREWYFHKEAGTWKLAGSSFVLGRCSCG